MFPWVPFFVYPQKSPHHRTQRQPNLLEEILEVRAVVDTTARNCPGQPPFRIVYHVPTEQSSSISLLPKAPTENIKIEFNSEKLEGEKTCEEVEAEDAAESIRCRTIASTSSGSTSNLKSAEHGAGSGHARSSTASSTGPKQSPKVSTESLLSAGKSPVLQRIARKRSAFETSQAMREIFGTDKAQKEEGKEVKCPEAQTSPIITQPQHNESVKSHEIDFREQKQKDAYVQGTVEVLDEKSFVENSVATTKSRQRNVARVAPFAYFPSTEETELQRPLSNQNQHRQQIIERSGVVREEKEKEPDQLKCEEREDAKEEKEGTTRRREKVEEATFDPKETVDELRPNELSEERQNIATRSERDKPSGGGGQGPLPGYRSNGQLVAEQSKLQSAHQSSKGGTEGRSRTENNSGKRTSGVTSGSGGGAGGGSSADFESPEMVSTQIVNGVGGGDSTEKQLLIRNAMVVNDDGIFKADILIEGEKIKDISQNISIFDGQTEIIDANGKCLLPAGIDVHTEILTDELEHLNAGTKAALCGGTGTIIDVLTLNGVNDRVDNLLARFKQIQSKINEVAECNVGLSICINKWQGETRDYMTQMVRKAGVNSFVLELSNDAELFEALGHAQSLGALSRVFPEDGNMAPILRQQLNRADRQMSKKFEAGRVQQLCSLSGMANAPISIISLSSSAAGRTLAEHGRSDGALMSAEVSVAVLSQLDPSKNPFAHVSLLNEETTDSLLELLANYQNAVCVSDQSAQQMSTNFVGQRMGILWEKAVLSGKIDPMRFVAVTSANAARCFNIYPQKGRIAVGSDADLVLWDFHNQPSDNFSSSNRSTPSIRPSIVILSGKQRFHSGIFVSSIESSGMKNKPQKFQYLSPNSPYLFSIVRLKENKFDFAEFGRQLQGRESVNIVENGPNSHSSPTGAQQINLTNSCNRNTQNDQTASRAATKVIQPPGGKSSSLW